MEAKEYDLSLNKWGPYNKEYLGVCHVADPISGATFNVELFPGFFRRRVLVSHANSDNGIKMWGANPSLTRFTYRYELEWKDKVYCDADFVITDDRRCDIFCTFVNETDMPQSVNMNLCASLQYPTVKLGQSVVGYHTVDGYVLPDGCAYIDAVEYDGIVCAESLASDGRYLGEVRIPHATGMGSALSGRYFSDNGHRAVYSANIRTNTVLLRYAASEETAAVVSINGTSYTVTLPAANGFSTAAVKFEECDVTEIVIHPTGKALTLDCLILGDGAENTEFRPIPHNVEPFRTVKNNGMTLSYEGIPSRYVIEWSEPVQMLRRYYCNDIGDALSLNIHDHVSSVIGSRDSLRVYESIMSEPIFLATGERRALHFTVSEEDCPKPDGIPELYRVASNPDGSPYVFSQNMMAYNTFLNVVYPIYTRRQYIRHNTPGRNWDSLYSWDSGFIGMGLATADFDRAFDCLNTYLTPVGDLHSPYIFHGSVVPTQIFLYQYLFNKYPQKRERLARIYPMIKQYFDFYAHMDTRDDQTGSGLLKTWDIFYNSGGWDDYPPQKYVMNAQVCGDLPSARNTSPIITTAITVLIARILRRLAKEMGIDDRRDYDETVKKYTEPILKYAWNEETGYFSYVVHDGKGIPKEFLKYFDGTDFNQGFDGIYPYIAGITDGKQDERILDNIRQGLMTDVGVGVVDRRASYYSTDGYWNGSVWMPHQWILWRSLLDHGEGELAFKIADTALKVWANEVNDSYCCFENFMSANGRGSGFHQFSGLSTPVLMFFESYYTPGTLTTGFDAAVLSEEWNGEKSGLTCRVKCGGESPTVLICLEAGKNYTFTVNGKTVTGRRVTDGAHEITLSSGENIVTAASDADRKKK